MIAPAERNAGFSLLEVLVAMMILAIGAASVLSLFAGAASTHRRGLDRTQAALVAEQVIAEVRGRYTEGSTAETLRARVEAEVPRLFGDYRWDLVLVEPALLERARGSNKPANEDEEADRPDWEPGELFVRVAVRWKRSGSERAESFETILLPRNADDPDAIEARLSRGNRLLPGGER